ncbi:MAG: transglutaminase-like domain-containing protein, partial [Clostridia bacterium]
MAITKSVKTAIYDFQIMAFLYIAISLASAIIFNVSLKIKWGFTFIGLFCILILAPIYYSYNFPEPIALILVLIFLLSCFIRIIFNNSSNKMNLSKQKNIDEKKLHKSFIEKIAAIIIVISIFSFSIANIVNPATSNTFPELIRSLNTEVRTFINELLREKITEPTTLSFGQLGKTDKIVYKFKPVAQMSIAKNTAVYLRMWSADTYKASTWINDSQSFKFAINDYINSSQADSNLVNYLNNNITNNSLALDVNTFGKTFFDVLKMDKEFKLDENGFIENNVTFYPLENIADDLKELMGVNKFVPLGASSLENPFFLKNREDLSQIVDYSEYNTIGFKSDSFSFSSLIAQATHDEKFNEKITILSENYKKACDLIIEDENADIDLKNRILAERLYSQYAKEKNVEISADLSDRTIAKAKELAGKDVFETFDNIKTYLNDNTSYTLSPGITPSESDYIDHFLFKAKKGFCTHYASTAVQMLRQNGYVARYAEGYRAQFKKGFGEYTPEGKIDILDSDGHAWVEVYFDGIGWIPFEATPSFETKILEYNPEGDV